MKELFEASFSAINIIPTVLLVLSLIYWLIVIFGIFDLDTVDLDVEADVDIDVDVEADIDLDADADLDADSEISVSGSVLWLNSVLSFFNIGRVPVMIVVSFFSLSLWIISVMLNHWLSNTSFLISFILLIPNMVASLFVAKIITIPFVKVFKKANEIQNNTGLEGKICKVTIPASHDRMGQALIRINGDTFNVNIKTQPDVSLQVGEQALVIEYQKDNKIYIVEPYKE